MTLFLNFKNELSSKQILRVKLLTQIIIFSKIYNLYPLYKSILAIKCILCLLFFEY